jgi:hypothetical protein
MQHVQVGWCARAEMLFDAGDRGAHSCGRGGWPTARVGSLWSPRLGHRQEGYSERKELRQTWDMAHVEDLALMRGFRADGMAYAISEGILCRGRRIVCRKMTRRRERPGRIVRADVTCMEQNL